MKFKAVWRTEAGCANTICSAISTVLREIPSHEKATLKFTQSKFYFASLSPRKDRAEAWVVIETISGFSTVICESLRENKIDIAISPKPLLLVLKYVGQAVLCSMRLTKRNEEPVLRFEFNFIDSPHSSLVLHDIPVEILKTEAAWKEPNTLPSPDCKLLLKYPVKRLIQFMEKFRHAGVCETGFEITLNANNNSCDLAISGKSDSNHKMKLSIPNQSTVPGMRQLSNSMVSVTVSVVALTFLLTHVQAFSDPSLSLIMLTADRVITTWTQIPNGYGCIRAFSPATSLNQV